MIIRRLQSENILKFSRLDLTFPPQGNIVISGDNESGKTAIIETICLGLFGRTANLDHDQTEKAIRWGSARGWISLDFTDTNGQELSVYRHFSRQEPPQAQLKTQGADDAMATGEDQVNLAVTQAAGMEFHHFIETIYLSQTSPEGEDPEAIVRMVAGVEDLEILASQMDAEIQSGRDQVNRIATELTNINQELTALNLQPGVLGEMQQKFNRHAEQKSSLEAKSQDLTLRIDTLGVKSKVAFAALTETIQKGKQTTLALWSQNLTNLRTALSALSSLNPGEASAQIAKLQGEAQHTLESLQSFKTIVDKTVQDGKSRSHWLSATDPQTFAGEMQTLADADAEISRSRSTFYFLLFLIFGLLIGGGALGLNFFPQDPRVILLSTTLAQTIPNLQPIHLLAAMGAGGLLLLISVLSLGKIIKNASRKSQNKQTRQSLQTRAEAEKKIVAIIDETAQLPLCQQIARLSSLGEQVPWSENLQQWQQSQGRSLVDETQLSALLVRWNDDFGQMKRQLESVIQKSDQELRHINEQITTLSAEIAGLQQEIQNEQERQNRDKTLRTRSQTLTDNRTQTAHGIDVRALAHQLIQGATQEIALGFSYDLRRLIAKTAPLFTRGRYQHLRVDENLNLSAFSPVKNDFVDLSETSRGLRRQLMLALRMALAQALTARAQTQAQFMILDEPFAHYDHDRFRESFQALGNISDSIRQIFIISQSFDEDLADSAALNLRCRLETDVMESVSP
ncbi:MAG: AAA 23 protein [Magnetococcales bacterium]|nr:AAA 23 protein [Magnetococcales bacterium]HIJ85669.1 AAA family ATPase [Magnetococcales bacterium]